MEMKIKRTIMIFAVCFLVFTSLSAVMVYAPKPEDPGNNLVELLNLLKEDTENIWSLPDNSHSWNDIQEAMDDIKNEISTIEDAVDNVNLPQLDEIVDITNKLDVEALCYPAQASTGNNQQILVHVYVTSFDGQAVTDLTVSNFFVHHLSGKTSGAPWGVTISFVGVNSESLYLYVEPNSDWSNTWGSGVQNFGIVVSKGSMRGRTLMSVTLQ